MARILVTGGLGAIGTNVVNLCIEKGYDVTVIDNFSSCYERFERSKYNLIECDVSDFDSMSKVFKKQFDYVIHLAAFFANQNSIDHPENDLLCNALGSLNVARLSADNGVKKVVYASSSCVYSKNSPIIEENTKIGDFDTPYAVSKYFGEKYFELYQKMGGADYSIVRIFNSYGPYESPGKYRNVIPNFFHLALRNQPLPIYGLGTETRDFTFVQDVANGMLLALLSEASSNEIFNIASGVETQILDLANKINAITNNSAGVMLLKRRSWDNVSNRKANISKASRFLGFRPMTCIDEGLEKTYEWLKLKK